MHRQRTHMPRAVPLRQHAVHAGGHGGARDGIVEQGAERVVAPRARRGRQLQGPAQVGDVGVGHRACNGGEGKGFRSPVYRIWTW